MEGHFHFSTCPFRPGAETSSGFGAEHHIGQVLKSRTPLSPAILQYTTFTPIILYTLLVRRLMLSANTLNNCVVFRCRSIKLPDAALFCCVSMYSQVCRRRRSLLLRSGQSIVACICECLCCAQAYLDIKVCLCVFVLGFSFLPLSSPSCVASHSRPIGTHILSLITVLCPGKKARGEGGKAAVESFRFAGDACKSGR